MARRLRIMAFEEESSDDDNDFHPEPRRPRWIRERTDWFLNYDDRDFETRFRLSKLACLHLVRRIEHKLEYLSDRNASLSPINQILTTLRYYATGCTQLAAADYIGVSKPTVNRVVHRVSAAIASLRHEYLKFPQTKEDIKAEQLKFYLIAKFPKVVGAMDCTHVRISSPGGDNAELFRNRKNYFSVNVQAICNSNMEFTDIVARWPGSCHDSTIFGNCSQRALFESNMYGDSVLLVDGGYATTPYLIPPLENPQTPAQHLFNESQIRSRNVVECMFGLWKRRFPVLALGMRVKLKNVFAVIVATAVLHNMLRQRGENVPPDDSDVNLPAPWTELLQEGEMSSNTLNFSQMPVNDATRQTLIANYFQSLL